MKLSTAHVLLACLTLSATLAATLHACDICGCYTPNQEINFEPVKPQKGGFYAASAEQYTFFGTTQFSGREVANVADQFEHSSITQLIAGYNPNDRVGVQVNVPLVYRDYKRPAGFRTDRGTESGIGDVSLLFNFTPLRLERGFHPAAGAPTGKDGKDADNRPPTEALLATGHGGRPDFTLSLNLIAGVKFPTGDPSRIKEEFSETEVEGAPPSGIHGHDLALGSGSYDAVLGAGLFTRYKAGFFQVNGQYSVRTTGAYDYRYANAASFDAGPGVFLLQGARVGGLGPATLGLQFVVSGEHKNRDTFRGEIARDTGATILYVGPRVLAGIGRRLIAELGADLPVVRDNTDFQVVPSYRLRAGFSVRF